MKRSVLMSALVAPCCAAGFLTLANAQSPPAPVNAPLTAVKITGPVTSGNLSVYLIHGQDKLPKAKILTLEEALAQKKIVISETGDVNNLTVKNVSNEMVFIQSGDIVKGGRQDRTMQYDMLVPPKSGVLPLPAFCVESGRWTGRGKESSAQFASSTNALASKELKIAAKAKGNQSDVWTNVAEMQSKLAGNSGYKAAASPSPSSFELTMENGDVEKAADAHIKQLEKITDGQNDVIGYGFAINGKINSADSYASHELFMKLWPKLLKSTAIEAVADEEKGKAFSAPSAEKVNKFVADAKKAPAHQKIASKASAMNERESADSYTFETRGVSVGQGQFYGGAAPAGSDRTTAPELHVNILAK